MSICLSMSIYLPVAEIQVSLIYLLSAGILAGFLSGLYGIGGGLITVPIMLSLGIDLRIVIATSTAQILVISAINAIKGIYERRVDVKLGFQLFIGSICGTCIGILCVKIMNRFDIFDIVVSIMYILMTSIISIILLFDGLIQIFIGGKIRNSQNYGIPEKTKYEIEWQSFKKQLANQMKAKIFDSEYNYKFNIFENRDRMIYKIFCGMIVGYISSIMGIGGGFITIPLMVYFFGINIFIATATSAFIISMTMLINAMNNFVTSDRVDIILLFAVVIASPIGSYFGSKIAKFTDQRILKIGFSILLMCVAIQFIFMITKPSSLISITSI